MKVLTIVYLSTAAGAVSITGLWGLNEITTYEMLIGILLCWINIGVWEASV